MKYTHIIWDFNGTLFDDVEAGLVSVNEMLSERGLKVIADKEEYRKVFKFPIIDYYRRVGFDFEKTPYEELAVEWVDIYLSNFDKAGLFADLTAALDFFASKGITQSVLSASELGMLKGQISDLGIEEYFDEIMGIDNIYAASKLVLAKSWRERHPDERVIFIGDTVHDIETAKQLSADCFIVCAGHQSREKFDGCDATVVSSLSELCELLKGI